VKGYKNTGGLMISLETSADWTWLLVLAAALGALGGLAYELIQIRRRNNEALNTASVLAQTNMPWPASLIIGAVVGAVAALAVLYIFPPWTATVTEAANGTTTTDYRYDVIKLVSLAVIAGSAGESLLNAAQARILAAVNQQKVQAVENVGRTQVEEVKNEGKTLAENHINNLTENMKSELEGIRTDVENKLQQAALKTPPHLRPVPPSAVSSVAAEELSKKAGIDVTKATQIYVAAPAAQQLPDVQVPELEELDNVMERYDSLANEAKTAIEDQLDTRARTALTTIETAAQ
jgi:predicted outer membrane lipoprotein